MVEERRSDSPDRREGEPWGSMLVPPRSTGDIGPITIAVSREGSGAALSILDAKIQRNRTEGTEGLLLGI